MTAPARVDVVIVDDDPRVRSGLRLLLGTDPTIRVVGEAGDGLEAAEVIARHRPDVVLMDIRMPRCDGITATARELRANPAQAIIVLTTFDADENVVRALQAGARGFLLKDAPPAELVAAVHEAASGRPALAAQVLEQVIRITAHHAQLPNKAERLAVASLTPREREVAEALARGASNAAIAAQLFLSIPTVKTHVGRILAKLGVDSRAQAATVLARGMSLPGEQAP
ncbi:response regulator [Microbacterium radiodurans]|uniref:Response regulator transcription factor n=1 Tax=Microbacterium radiodurans TaxID=661398 RepID=A0A5J5IN58_9MICO|nr:response regulator transcription factor [Microbacterium radiodurans]KAA9084149.1 response regulator transcription factor [Microbacterium radiodurans]